MGSIKEDMLRVKELSDKIMFEVEEKLHEHHDDVQVVKRLLDERGRGWIEGCMASIEFEELIKGEENDI